jgi:hypothetical protein
VLGVLIATIEANGRAEQRESVAGADVTAALAKFWRDAETGTPADFAAFIAFGLAK